MKEGLCRADIKKYHNMLKKEMHLKEIARKLHTRVDVLKRLTPEKMAKSDKAKKLREAEIRQTNIENRRKADVLAQTAANIMKDGPSSKNLFGEDGDKDNA